MFQFCKKCLRTRDQRHQIAYVVVTALPIACLLVIWIFGSWIGPLKYPEQVEC